MFDVLVESNRRGRRDVKGTIGGIFMSTIFQTALITAAVMATFGELAEESGEIDMDTIMLTLDEPEPEPEDQPPPPPIITSLNPPPKGFQVLMAPVEIPKEIPPIDLSQRFDPRDYSGMGVEGGVFQGIEGGTGPVVDLSQVFAESVVDEVPERLSCPSPRYPRMMQQANLEGEVLLQFVVEADGHVKRPMIEIMSSTHKTFESAARDMIQRCLFRPGKVRTTSVRVLVQMPVVFVLHSR